MARRPRTPEEWIAAARAAPRKAPVDVLTDDMTEQAWQYMVLRNARLCGWNLTYHTWLSVLSTSGFPDLVLVRPPRMIYAELKTNRGTLRPSQRVWLEQLAQCNVEVYLWRPMARDRVLEILGWHYQPQFPTYGDPSSGPATSSGSSSVSTGSAEEAAGTRSRIKSGVTRAT